MNAICYIGMVTTEIVLSEGTYSCDAENLFLCYSIAPDGLFILQ
jgi:hypothetical protein